VCLKVEYKIKEWTDDHISLVRFETREPPVQGLSPVTSQSIGMDKSEVQQIMELLKEYGNQRRN